MRIFFILLLAGVSVTAGAQPLYPSPGDWRDLTFYQIVTDRWYDGDPSNNTANPDGFYNPSGGFDLHGGDFAGLRQKLYYLEGLGVGAVWISPIPRNVNAAYHGYAAQDFTTVDPHWGSQTELEAFIDEAHARGIRVILDVVAGHTGTLLTSSDSGWPSYNSAGTYNLNWRDSRRYAAPFDNISLFHRHGHIGNFSDPEQILGELFGLDDLRTEDAAVRTAMVTIWSDWVTELDADAFRIDTVKHIDLGFWQTWTPQVRANVSAAGKANFFMFGEVFDGSDFKNGIYTGTQAGGAFALDSTLDYPLYFRTNDVFARANTGAQTIENHYASIPSFYDPAARDRLVTFLDNHDNPRFLSGGLASGDRARLEAALVFQLTARGVPTIYYGTEQGFNGGGDPFDREDMFDGQFEQGPSLGDNFDQTAPLYRFVRRLNQLRRDHEPLRRGAQVAREVHGSPGVYAYSRLSGGKEVLVAINTDPANGHFSQSWSTSYAAGTVLVDRLDSSFTITVGADGLIPGHFHAPSDRRIFVPQSELTNWEPEVVAIAPIHDQLGTSSSAGITVAFSEAMNQASAQTSFSTDPARTGAFTWNAAGNEVTFVPDSDWPSLTTVKVFLADTAQDLNGAGLRGGFQSIFHTNQGPAPDPPAAVGPLDLHPTPIVVDGDASDWIGTPGTIDTAFLDTAAQELIWKDSIGDDLGDGDYAYPTNAVFTGGDADLDEVRIAVRDETLYILLRPSSINPGASFFTPYFGVAIDTDQVDGSGRTDLGIELDIPNGGADAILSPQLAWEIQAALPGPNPLRVTDAAGNLLAGGQAAFNQSIGVVEIALPFGTIGSPSGQKWDFVVYSGLETFNQLREVRASNAEWEVGGGFDSDALGNDPDIFDLAGSAPATQTAELAGYSGANPARIAQSALVVQFAGGIPVELSSLRLE